MSYKIVFGITGGIAAFKVPEAIRELVSHNAEVIPVLTTNAKQFVTATTLSAISGNRAREELWDLEAEQAMSHIELARWADGLIIAPATANSLSQLASGAANNLLSTLYLATEAPTFIAPAMNQRMWQHSATQRNIATLRSDGVEIIGPNDGLQACGEEGPGRMAEPKEIIHQVLQILGNKKNRKTVHQKNTAQDYLTGKNILITAGPTREPIDPVRYITNSSSGRQGYALAEAAIEAGSKVTLISGPVSIPKPPVSELINVTTAREMKKAVTERVKKYDMVIAVAAVADYRPAESKDLKIKKLPNSENHLSLNLVENDDIVASVSSLPNRPFMVGFAAETHNAVQFAREKRLRKNLDVIVCNDVSDSSIGFESNENAVTVIYENGEKVLEKASKQEIARELIHLFGKLYSEQKISRVG